MQSEEVTKANLCLNCLEKKPAMGKTICQACSSKWLKAIQEIKFPKKKI